MRERSFRAVGKTVARCCRVTSKWQTDNRERLKRFDSAQLLCVVHFRLTRLDKHTIHTECAERVAASQNFGCKSWTVWSWTLVFFCNRHICIFIRVERFVKCFVIYIYFSERCSHKHLPQMRSCVLNMCASDFETMNASKINNTHTQRSLLCNHWKAKQIEPICLLHRSPLFSRCHAQWKR